MFLEGDSLGDAPAPRRGTRITPRTCLWPLAGSLVLTFALSIGLTFRSNHHCYAGTCGEWLFPLQARLHVVVWYSWISISITFLAIRAFHPKMQKLLDRPLLEPKLPILGKRLTLGGAVLLLWITTLYGVVVAIWWIRLRDYFVDRGRESGILIGGGRLAAIALTGHLCDITMGMVLIPISRHSALASFFQLSVSTTLANHMLTAYTLFSIVLTHAFLYVAWVPVFESLSSGLRMVIPILNPTYLYDETWPGNTTHLGIWRASLIFTGLVAIIIMAALFVTTLPKVRSNHFNLFYFTHLLSIVMVIIVCLHASTIFYCIAPGLAMWFLDWGMRLYELRRVLESEITTIGKGWYSLKVSLPRSRLTGCSCKSPIAYFYIHHAGSSLRELHPFTTITPLAAQNAATPPGDDEFPIQFLFRKRGKPNVTTNDNLARHTRYHLISRLFRGTKERYQSTEWTNKLASLVDKEIDPLSDVMVSASSTPSTSAAEDKVSPAPSALSSVPPQPKVNIVIRLEGPYFSPADPYRYDTVICLVAGTGISGALAIARAFTELQRQRSVVYNSNSCCRGGSCTHISTSASHWQHCIVVWSVKSAEAAELPFFTGARGLEVQTHLTGAGQKRINMREKIQAIGENAAGRIWVYISGPKPFLESGKEACKAIPNLDLDVYAPSWDV